MTIGERLRKARGETPREMVAQAVGITVSAISNYENNLRVPRDSVKLRFADYFGCTVQELFY